MMLLKENGKITFIISFLIKLDEMQEFFINEYQDNTGNILPAMPKYDHHRPSSSKYTLENY